MSDHISIRLNAVEVGNAEHCEVLFQLLSLRNHTISHVVLPSKEAHENFVNNHPYRHWYFIERDQKKIGTVYLTFENTMSIFLPERFYSLIGVVISIISKLHAPLEPIKSVRPSCYQMNVPVSDQAFADVLVKEGYGIIQKTFLLEN